MGDILRNWIQARLGILIDLRPEVFGHYTRDGSLLAQILHSYDIINQGQLDTIIVTQDPALCRVNLKHLRFWLRFLGIDCDDESIEEVSCGKGATSLRLFYKLYLCLETKDRLHFITLQKERERFAPTSKKFEVTRVCEDPPPYQPPEHPLSEKLVKGKDIVEWHRSKIPNLLRKLQTERQKWVATEPYPVVELVERCVAEPSEVLLDGKKEQSQELDRFAAKHRVRTKRLEQKEEGDGEEGAEGEWERDVNQEEVQVLPEDPEMARMYVEWLKNRRKRATTVNALKLKMQKTLLSELWERMAEKQERVFDEVIARRVLDQSRYEKQIVTKLCEVREQKNIMAENQKVVEDITVEATEVEHRASYERDQDLVSKKNKDIETECQRMCELRKRLLLAKIEKIREKHWNFCREMVKDLASIALNVGDHRRVNDGRVPLTLLSEWKTMFVKSQPIFEEQIPYVAEHEHSSQEQLEVLLKSDVWTKYDTMEMFQDALFDDYLETKPPWDESLPMLGEDSQELLELGRTVLGYIVHRLLDGLYTSPLSRSQTLLPKSKNVAIILGIGSATVYESIRALLDHVGIRAVRMEDAINYCLKQYKQEISDVEYIDLNIIAATAEIVEELQSSKKRISCLKTAKPNKRSRWADEVSTSSLETATKKSGKSREKRKSDASTKTVNEEAPNSQDKQTQTPRNIPYDDIDPLLTDSAYIGKWTYEFLTLGEPITNELATKILIEYLKSLTNAKSWALIDYPNTYDQMARLETAMTGCSPPPEPKSLEFEHVTMEDIETTTPRIIFEDKSDPYASNRHSKLVPDPIVKRNEQLTTTRTFATLFVRMKQQPKYFERGELTYEALKEDAPSVDKYYVSRKIAYILYYSSFDLITLKKLARLVIGEPLQRKSSEELFGDALKSFERDTKRGTTLKEAAIRRLLTEEEVMELELDTAEAEEEDKHDFISDDFQIELDSRLAKPGEPHWQWIDFPLSSMLLGSLANLWEGLEKIYMEEIKDLLLLKSIHSSSVAPYTDFITRNAGDFIRRPDKKQDLLHQFHKAFNAIDADARNDGDVKCELHRRVADFQAELWHICDERRRVAEEERKRYIEDHWGIYEAIIVFNIYVGIIQVEIDRCIDTVQLLQDYYLGMMKKSLQEITVSKVTLNKIETDEADLKKPEEEPTESPSIVDKLSERKKSDRGKSKNGSTRMVVIAGLPPAAIDRAVLQKEIDNAFIDRDKNLESVEQSCLFRGIMENVRFARNLVNAAFAEANEVLKREQAALSKTKDLSTEPAESIVSKIAARGQDLTLEWQYALGYEMERVRLKLESIVGVARLDVAFLLESLQRTFHGIYDSILQRYWQEMKSVNEMANVFCFAIEESRLLEKEMLLDGDRFVIRSNVYVVEMEPKKKISVKETASPVRFRIANLARILEIFRRVAPYGTMCERTLVYILQDLASFGQEEGETMLLPCSWYQLRSTDISTLVSKLFGSIDRIDWREFLIYAMDLPIPSCREMLIARDRFRIQDPDLKEVVSRAQYHRTPLWFLECTDTCVDAQQLLSDGFERNREGLFDEELYHFDGDAPSPLQAIQSSVFDLKPCDTSPEETLRGVLAKELLCRMYMIDQYTINYTALLLAFCKEEDPREGFGKALALAVGNRVCTNMEEGERYAENLLQTKRLGGEAEMSPEAIHREALEVAGIFMNYLIYRVEKRIDRGSSHVLEDASVLKLLFRESTASESFAEMECFSSGEIPHGEFSFDSLLNRRAKDHEVVVYWISLDLCLTVLAAALPWDVLKPQVVGRCRNLRDSLALVFKELRDENLNDETDMVLAHRLLNHEFVKRLLTSVSHFTAKNMGNIVEEILRERSPRS